MCPHWQERLRMLAQSTDIPLSGKQYPPASERLTRLAQHAHNRRAPIGFLRPDHFDLRGLYVKPAARPDGRPASAVRGPVHSARAPSYWYVPPPPAHRDTSTPPWQLRERGNLNGSLEAFEERAQTVNNFRPHLTTRF